MGEEQSPNWSQKRRSETRESGTVAEERRGNRPVWERAKEGGRQGGTGGEREMLSWIEGRSQTVRGPEGDPLAALCSVAAPGPCFEATLP